MKIKLILLIMLTSTFISAQVANTVSDLNYCNDSNNEIGVFDISTNNSLILGNQNPSDFILSYHTSQSDADSGVNQIANLMAYGNTSNPESIYARVEQNSSGNFATTTFDLNVITIPEYEFTEDQLIYELCSEVGNTTGVLEYDLETYALDILQIDPVFPIAFYEGLDSSALAIDLISNPYAYSNTSQAQVVYMTVSNSNSNGDVCSLIVPITLQVNNLPAANDYFDYVLCDDEYFSAMDAIQIFDLASQLPNMIASTVGVSVSYYVNYDFISGTLINEIPNSDITSYENIVNPQDIFVEFTNELGCSIVKILKLTVAPNPTPLSNSDIVSTLGNQGVLEVCDGNIDGSGDVSEQKAIFDISQWETSIIDMGTGVSVSYHESYDAAASGVDLIANPTSYTNIFNPQTIYVSVFNDFIGCSTIVQFDIFVPVTDIAITGGNILIIDDAGNPINEVILTAVAGDGSLSSSYNYQWLLNGVIIPGAFNDTYIVTAAGNYSVTISGPTDFSCINTASFTVAVTTISEQNLTVAGFSETCVDLENGMIVINANDSYSYEVTISQNGNPILITPNTFNNTINITDLASGTYYVCITNTEIEYTECYDVFIEAVENLTGFSERIGSSYSLYLTGSKQYNIDINDVITQITATTSSEIIKYDFYLSNTITDVKVTSDKECQGSFEEKVFLDINNNDFQIYPNPVLDTINFTTGTVINTIEFYNISGKLVMKKSNIKNKINVMNLSKGLYFIKIISGNTVQTTKFLKK